LVIKGLHHLFGVTPFSFAHFSFLYNRCKFNSQRANNAF